MLEGPILKSFTINGPINSQEKKNEETILDLAKALRSG